MAERYTLEEARVEMARQECAVHGHDFDVIEEFGAGPVALICSRGCGESWPVSRAVFEVRAGAGVVRTVAIYSNRDAADEHAESLRVRGHVADVEIAAVKDKFDG